MTRDMGFLEFKYNSLPGQKNFILERPGAVAQLVKAYLVWAALLGALVGPSMWVLFRSHAHRMAPKEGSIVYFRRPINSQESSLRALFQDLNRDTLLRLIRNMIQIGVVAGIVLGFTGYYFLWQIKRLDETLILLDWFVRAYLSFGGEVQGMVVVWYTFFLGSRISNFAADETRLDVVLRSGYNLM